jgi:hypothetical protein
MNPVDTTLEDAVAEAVAERLTGGTVFVPNRRELAKRAALDGFKQAITLVEKVVAEMATNHELRGDSAGAAALREVVIQVRILPSDLA